MIDRLESLAARYREIEEAVADPAASRDQVRFRDLMRERSRLAVIDEAFRDWVSDPTG